ncbi:MAG: hypothetical protein KBT32_06355 [Bacteroidales bacterium]|nr:hypothetical protein [Candidatus Physcocola equi]
MIEFGFLAAKVVFILDVLAIAALIHWSSYDRRNYRYMSNSYLLTHFINPINIFKYPFQVLIASFMVLFGNGFLTLLVGFIISIFISDIETGMAIACILISIWGLSFAYSYMTFGVFIWWPWVIAKPNQNAKNFGSLGDFVFENVFFQLVNYGNKNELILEATRLQTFSTYDFFMMTEGTRVGYQWTEVKTFNGPAKFEYDKEKDQLFVVSWPNGEGGEELKELLIDGKQINN